MSTSASVFPGSAAGDGKNPPALTSPGMLPWLRISVIAGLAERSRGARSDTAGFHLATRTLPHLVTPKMPRTARPRPLGSFYELIELPRFPERRGSLTFIEGGDHVPFAIAGANSRLDELQAAFLRTPLPRLAEENTRRSTLPAA